MSEQAPVEQPLLLCNAPGEVRSNGRASVVGGLGHGWLAAGLLVIMMLFEIVMLQEAAWPVQKVLPAIDNIDTAVPGNMTELVASDERATNIKIKGVIMQPQVMYDNFGMVSPPIICVSAKALFNFVVQQSFLVGSAVWEGKAQIKERLSSPAKFGKLSIGFQVVGQVSAVYSYTTLVQASRPWEGGANSEAFQVLVAQHSSSVTILVGLCNNVVMPHYVESKQEARIAKVLTGTGLFVGLPLWAAILTAGFPYNFACMMIVLAFGFGIYAKSQDDFSAKELLMILFGFELPDPGKFDFNLKKDATASWPILLFLGAVVLNLGWLAVGIWTHPLYTCLNFGAFWIEVVGPCCLLLYIYLTYLDVADDRVGTATLISFMFAGILVYLVNMIVPTSILSRHGHATDAAALAFRGKKIGAYFKYTFMFPVAATARTTTAFATKYAHVVPVWLSEIIGLPA